VTATRSASSTSKFSARSRVVNGSNETKNSRSRLSRRIVGSASSRYSVTALCATQIAPIVAKLTR
jgi:hypothetical protein